MILINRSTLNIKKIKNPQKLFGCIGSQIKALIPLLSNVNVKVSEGKRCKPKKNSGTDHILQGVAAKLCGHKSIYRMNEAKTPNTLKRMDIKFLQKSTHYDNLENIELDSIWFVNALFLYYAGFAKGVEQLVMMLDLTPDPLKGEYEGKELGYIGRKNGEPVIGECHQLVSVSLARFKQSVYKLRLPGGYNSFSNPEEHGDRNLLGLNFNETVADHVVKQAHRILPNKSFLWLFDRGFDCFDFWRWLKELGDDFVTAADSNIECLKQAKRRIESGAVLLKKAKDFSYYETLTHIDGMALKAVYILSKNNKAYWLLTTKTELPGEEIKKLYNMRSGDEPLYDYLKNDYNVKKPCKKNFAGAQNYTALLCLVHNIISFLSQKIFNAYHRLNTLTSLFLELTILQLIFQPTKKSKPVIHPPQKTIKHQQALSHRHAKK